MDTVRLGLEDDFGSAGEVLRGFVFFSISKEIPREAARPELILSLEGNETSQVKYYVAQDDEEDTDGDKTMASQWAVNCRNIIQLTLPKLANKIPTDKRGAIAAGHYKLPFQIALPDELPTSFHFQHKTESYCSVQYTLQVVAKYGDERKHKECRRIVPVQASSVKPTGVPVPFQEPPEVFALNSGWCCGGCRVSTVQVGAQLDDTIMPRGASTKVLITMSTASRKPAASIPSIQLQLIEYYQWKADESKRESSSRVLWKHMLHSRAGQSITEDDIEYHEPFTIPTNAMASYESPLIRMHHVLEVKILMESGEDDAMCCATYPESIRIPLRVTQKDPETAKEERPPYAEDDGMDLPIDLITLPTMKTRSEQMQKGGPTVAVKKRFVSQNDETAEDEDEEEERLNSLPLQKYTSEPSLSTLLRLMKESVSIRATINDLVEDTDWEPFWLSSVSPKEYTDILRRVQSSFDQTPIALQVANAIGSSKFSCDYVVAALSVASSWNRCSLVEQLIPLCCDLKRNQNTIRSQLNGWEANKTRSAFEEAVAWSKE